MTNPHEAEIARLRRELREAREELDAYKENDADGETLGIILPEDIDAHRVLAFRRAFPVRTAMCARLAWVLYHARGPMTYGQLDDALPDVWVRDGRDGRKDPRAYFSVLVCYMRQAMGHDAVVTHYGIGISLSDAGRAKLKRVWGPLGLAD